MSESTSPQQAECCSHPRTVQVQVDYEDYFNPAWFLDEQFMKQTFSYGSVGVDLSGLSWDAVQSGAGYNRIGHTLWAAGHTLAQYLADNPLEVSNKRVLEVGKNVDNERFLND